MNALRNAHRALRPTGVLLDVMPEPGDPLIEVVRDGTVVATLRRDESSRTAQIGRVRVALDQLVAEGLFVRELAHSFDFVSHADGVDDWLVHRAEKGSSALDEGFVARLRAVAADGAALRICERVTAARLRCAPEYGR